MGGDDVRSDDVVPDSQLFERACSLFNTCTGCKSFHDSAQFVADAVRYEDTAGKSVCMCMLYAI